MPHHSHIQPENAESMVGWTMKTDMIAQVPPKSRRVCAYTARLGGVRGGGGFEVVFGEVVGLEDVALELGGLFTRRRQLASIVV
jgi:hypothetical protein